MGKYVAEQVVKLMIQKGHKILNARVLQLGITFKENCPDIRNSHAVDVVRSLQEFGCDVDVYDPWADPEEAKKVYNLLICNKIDQISNCYDAVVPVVAHREFYDFDTARIAGPNTVVFDVKGIWPMNKVTMRL